MIYQTLCGCASRCAYEVCGTDREVPAAAGRGPPPCVTHVHVVVVRVHVHVVVVVVVVVVVCCGKKHFLLQTCKRDGLRSL